MSDCGMKAAAYRAHELRNGVRNPHGRLCAGFLTTLLMTTALTWPTGPAHADCDVVGNTANCTGNLSGGVTNQGLTPDFTSPPVEFINIFNVFGNIAPPAPISGIDAQTTGDDSPLTIFVDIAPFAIITQGDLARGIFARTDGINSGIDITNRAAITTQGGGAHGIEAETSGDGSTLTINNWGAIATQGPAAHGIDALTGDFLGSTSDGSTITINNWGAISTQRDGAFGIFAQTLGFNSGVDITNRAAITTQGFGSSGIIASTDGDNSDATVNNWGTITTQGNGATGISARTGDFSGGTGDNSDATVNNWGTITTQGNGADGIAARTLDDNADITITNRAAITTQGESAEGIFAETDGDNSGVTVNNWGAITTQSNGGRGIFAQTGDFLAGTGDGSTITINNWGPISTQGFGARGIGALTVYDNSGITINNRGAITTQNPGSSGIWVETESTNSPVIINNWANVIVNGTGADGVRAEVDDASSDVTISLFGGMVQGGTGTGDGIDLADVVGLSTVNVFAGAMVTTLGDNAIEGAAGNETVNNAGTVTGSVNLGTGTNAFNNMAGGLFNAGPIVNLGGGNLLSNAGTFAPGGIGTFQPLTEVTGDFTQTGSGVLAVDLLFGSLTADLTNVTGTSTLSGQVVPNILNPRLVQPFIQQQATILTSTGGVTNAGLTVQDTAVMDYVLLFPDDFTVVLGATADFAPFGLNQNQTSVGAAINAIQAAGGSAAFAPVVGGLVTLPDLASLADAYDQLGPGAYLGNGIATLFSSLDFADDLMSCEVREGGNVFIREGQCVWAEATGNWFDQDRTAETVDFDQVAPRIAGGFQAALAPDWRFGMAFGYQRSNLEALNGRQDSESDTLHGGAVLKYLFGDALLAAAVSGGHGWYDTTRNFDFGGFAAQASASHGISHLTGRLRGAYAFTNGVYYIKPLVDLNVSWIGIDGFTESGGNGAALIVQRTDETVLSASPALEFGWQHWVEDGTLFRPYLRAGVTVFDDPELTLLSNFAAAPSGAPAFRTVMGTDDVVGEVAVGLDLLTPGGTVLKAFYETQFGEDTSQQLAGIRASRPF